MNSTLCQEHRGRHTSSTSGRRSLRLALGALALVGLMAGAQAQSTVRASISTMGVQADANCPQASISADGRYVVFTSFASNLVSATYELPPDSLITQVFKRDLLTNTTVLVSVNAFGFAGNANSYNPRVSADGRYVSFSSDATNLDGVDGNGSRDVFRRDTLMGSTIRVSVADDEAEGNTTSDSSSISADGNLIAFRSHATNLVAGGTSFSQVFLRNVSLGTTELVSKSDAGVPGDSDSGGFMPSITPNGRYIGFTSKAGNLVAGDTNGNWDVYLRDMQLNVVKRVSLPTNGAQYYGMCHTSAVSDDGRYVAFASVNAFNITDTNGTYDVFLRDTVANTLTRMSDNSKGKSSNGASGDSEGWGIRISGDGMKVVFQSLASDLVNGDANGFEDVFVRNRSTNKTTRVSVSTTGGSANGASISPTISSNGYIAFVSDASNLVAGDTNGFTDAFRRGSY